MQRRITKSFVMADIVGGLLQSVKQAKLLGDLETARIAQMYREKGISNLSVPAFTIDEVEIELKFVVAGPVGSSRKSAESGLPQLKVHIDPEALESVTPEKLSSMRIRFKPVDMKVFKE